MLSAKHKGGGRWIVVGTDDEEILGPVTKAEAMEYIAAASQPTPETPVAVSEDDQRQAQERINERAWAAKLDAAHAETLGALEEKYRKLLAEDFGEDTATAMMRELAPMLKAGKEYRRRERMRFVSRKAA